MVSRVNDTQYLKEKKRNKKTNSHRVNYTKFIEPYGRKEGKERAERKKRKDIRTGDEREREREEKV